LRAHPDPAALPPLLAALEAGDRLLARLAGDALAALGSAAVPDLLHRLEAQSPLVRGETARALALIGDKRSIPALFSVLDDGSALVTIWAQEGLARMGVGMVYYPSG
jgi:HEAT repeat protein